MSEGRQPELADTVAQLSTTRPDAVGPAPSLARGAAIGRYLVVEQLGAGGMGVVYAAYDPELDRKVALKMIRPRVQRDEEGRTRMLREAQAIARLQHPNVVAVHDVGTHGDGDVFIAMELVDGVSLSRWMSEPHTVAELLEVFVQAGRGLAAAHAADLVHRDFKPDNVLVGRDGRARVLDFGLVRGRDAVDSETTLELRSPRRASEPVLSAPLTQVGSLMGTPGYMAPEQLEGRSSDARSDQYSFCVSLFQGLAGRLPFESATFEQLAEQVSGPPPEFPSTTRKVAARIRAATLRGLSRDPNARFADMNALLAELAPRTSWRRGAVVGGAGAIAAGGIAIAALATASHGGAAIRCDDGRARLTGAWDDVRRQAVSHAFLATGVPYARDELAAVTRGLDAYSSAWANSFEDACRATNERGESVDTLDRRDACLLARRTELAGVVDLLGSVTATDIARAHVAVAAIAPVADCDRVAIAGVAPPPSDAATQAKLAAFDDDYAHVMALDDAARFVEARPQALALVARARAVGYGPAVARALVLEGFVEQGLGDHAAARDAFAGGLEAAASVDEVRAAVAAGNLAGVESQLGNFKAAHQALEQAARYAANAAATPLLRAIVAFERGSVLRREGKYEAAVDALEQARAIYERSAPGTVEHARTLSALADDYDEVGRYRDARSVGEQALGVIESELGHDHPEVADVLTNLGNIAADEGDLDGADAAYRRALAVRQRAGDTPGLADLYNNLGALAAQRKRIDDALGYLQSALTIRERLEPGGANVAMSLTNLASIEREGRHDCAAAMALLDRALPIAERLGPEHPYVADALYEIGECKLATGALEDAERALDRARAIRSAGARPIEIGEVDWALARTLWERGRHADAIARARSARTAFATTDATKDALADVDAWLASHR